MMQRKYLVEMGIPTESNRVDIGVRRIINKTFPLNFSYYLVKFFSGENDGLVDEKSFEWGENYILLKPTKERGISHGDMIDLNRENISGFDVREFYVDLVRDLKDRGF